MNFLIYTYGFLILILISIIDLKTQDVYLIMPIAGMIPLLFISSLPIIIFSIITFVTFYLYSLITKKLGTGDSFVFALAALLLDSPNLVFNMIFLTFALAIIYTLILKLKGINRFIAFCPFILVSTIFIKFTNLNILQNIIIL